MSNNISSDKPINQPSEDRFQRYNFAKRIATTIKERENTDCIVIGLYGAWGEGKTSVLNFINNELASDDNVLIIKFNPWRFKDEEALLNDFFNLLANKLNASLKSDGQKASGLLKKYGKLTALMAKLIPFAGELIAAALEQVGEVLSNDTVEDVKRKIDGILIENKKKIVVFIDDIDRLDKTEIHSIFRLVKLTADFYNTTYILSFDEQMVASAIGERFGEGNKESGKSFLEKIIQVPLNLPRAQPAALQQLCFDIINNIFKSNKIELSNDEGKIFSSEFQSNILLRLTTPRLAVRYGNALSFSIPLLNGEVNIDDLLLIEAIKIFYPRHYEFIKLNSEFFIGSYKEIVGARKDSKKVDLVNEHLDKLATDLTLKEKNSIKALLVKLFPRLNEIYYNHVYSDFTETALYKNMQIGSTKHFNRFFSYAVIKGDLSDIAFRDFINDISEQPTERVAHSIKKLVEQSSPENFLLKIRSLEGNYNWEASKKISKGISIISEIFPKYEGFGFMRFQEPYGQSQILIYQLIKQHAFKAEQFEHARELIEGAKIFEFAYDLKDWFISGDKKEQRIFSEEELLQLDYVLIKRAIHEARDVSIFGKYPNHIVLPISSWAVIDKPELLNYTTKTLEKNSNEVLNLLKIYTPTGWSSLYPDTFKRDFTQEVYQHFISIFNKEYIIERIKKVFSEEKIKEEQVEWVGKDKNSQTDLNIVRQFFHWVNEDKI